MFLKYSLLAKIARLLTSIYGHNLINTGVRSTNLTRYLKIFILCISDLFINL